MSNWYVVNNKRFGAWFKKTVPEGYKLAIREAEELPYLAIVKKGWFWFFGEQSMFSLYPFGEVPEITVQNMEGEQLAKQMLQDCPYEYEIKRSEWGDFTWEELVDS